MHGTLDLASDPKGYPLVRSRGPTALAIGKFDGVHRGHRRLLARTVREAQRHGLQAGAVTFDVHPLEVLRGAQVRYLATPAERASLLADAGMDFVLMLRGTPELFAMEAEEFATALVSALDSRVIVVGANFRFGRGGVGTASTFTEVKSTQPVRAIALDLLPSFGVAVSSTRIRAELDAGRVREAADMLGRPVAVHGILSAATADRWIVRVPPNLALPLAGSYLGEAALIMEDSSSPAMPVVVGIAATGIPGDELRVVPSVAMMPAGARGAEVRVIFEERLDPHG